MAHLFAEILQLLEVELRPQVTLHDSGTARNLHFFEGFAVWLCDTIVRKRWPEGVGGVSGRQGYGNVAAGESACR